MIRRLRRCGHAPGASSPEDQAVVDEFRAMLTALRNPEPWTPGTGNARDIAVRIGPFVERAQTRPGDDHGPDLIAVTLVHPSTPHAGRHLGYTGRDWLRCPTTAIIGFWQPGYTLLTHAANGLHLPDDIGMARRAHPAPARPVHPAPARPAGRRPAHRRTGRPGDHPRARVPDHHEVRAVLCQRPPAVHRPVRDRRRRAPEHRRCGRAPVT